MDETVTLLLVRHSHNAAVDFLDTVERSEALRLEWIGPERFHAACALFRKYADKEDHSCPKQRFEKLNEEPRWRENGGDEKFQLPHRRLPVGSVMGEDSLLERVIAAAEGA